NRTRSSPQSSWRNLARGRRLQTHGDECPRRRSPPALPVSDQAVVVGAVVHPVAVGQIERLRGPDQSPATRARITRQPLTVCKMPAVLQLAPCQPLGFRMGPRAPQLTIDGTDDEMPAPPRGLSGVV